MQPNDNKWGIPLEMMAWFFPIVLLALAAAMITPLINRKEQRLKKERIAVEQMAEKSPVSLSTSCATEPTPVEQRCQQVVIPRVEFRQSSPVDAVDFVLSAVKGSEASEPWRRSLIPPDELESTQMAHTERYARLLEVCSTNLITVTLCDCTLLEALEYVTSTIGLSYAFEGDQIVICSGDGTVLVRE